MFEVSNFQWMGHLTTKMNTTVSVENVVPNAVLKFFLQKSPYWLNESQKTGLGHIFSHGGGSIGLIVFKNNRFHPCVDPHQPGEFHENWFKTATCIITVIIIISWKPRSVVLNVNWRTSTTFCCLKVYSFERKFYGE